MGWTSSLGAVAKVTNSDGSSYKGLTSASIDGSTYLYAANFTKGRVDVFDNAFHRVFLAGGDLTTTGCLGVTGPSTYRLSATI